MLVGMRVRVRKRPSEHRKRMISAHVKNNRRFRWRQWGARGAIWEACELMRAVHFACSVLCASTTRCAHASRIGMRATREHGQRWRPIDPQTIANHPHFCDWARINYHLCYLQRTPILSNNPVQPLDGRSARASLCTRPVLSSSTRSVGYAENRGSRDKHRKPTSHQYRLENIFILYDPIDCAWNQKSPKRRDLIRYSINYKSHTRTALKTPRLTTR